jgi:hypothetical protein
VERGPARFLVLLLLSFLVLVVVEPVCAVSIDEADDAISQAERDLGLAYTNVADAAGSGVNVTLFLDKLSLAGADLSDAHVAYRIGDYVSAFSYAEACSNAVDGVSTEAAKLRWSATIEGNLSVILTEVGSFVGLILLAIFGLLGWRFLSKRLLKRVLDLKPAVD